MSSEFNYKRAHTEWALPEWHKLSKQVQDIYRRVNDEGRELCQNKALDIDWPEDTTLRADFEAVPPEELAKAAHVIYGLGHWDTPESGTWPRSEHGAHWKFKRLAKQILAGRLPEAYDSYGPSMSRDDGWMMDHVEGTDYDNGELPDLLAPALIPFFTAESVEQANYKQGHPFCIGNEHITGMGSNGLDLSKPCAMRGCTASYEEHTSDKILLVHQVAETSAKNVELSDDEKKCLEDIAPLLEEYKIDGIAFVRRYT